MKKMNQPSRLKLLSDFEFIEYLIQRIDTTLIYSEYDLGIAFTELEESLDNVIYIIKGDLI